MKRSSVFDLRLHGGKAPPWLVSRMRTLAKPILELIVLEYGVKRLLEFLADPFWFQGFSYVLGYDWDSSGVTTVTTGVLREVLSEELGVLVAGGKGKLGLKTPEHIRGIGEVFGFSDSKVRELIRASFLSAKVDNAVLQDGHSLYHHSMIIDKYGDWVVIQQGMNPKFKSARRYHWISKGLKSFVVDPREIVGDIRLPFALDMSSSSSLEAQRVSVDIVKEGITQLRKDYSSIVRLQKKTYTLDTFFEVNKKEEILHSELIRGKIIPVKINWKALREAYEIQPKDYEALISIKGIGPGTIRALALISELIYNAEVSWKDPIRYTFAHGGKDGVPYPVNVKRMERVAEILESIIEDVKIGKTEKKKMLKKLSRLIKLPLMV